MQHREAGGVVAPFEPRLRHLARGLQHGEHPEGAVVEAAAHDGERGLVEVLAAGGADPQPDRSHPVRDAGAPAQEVHDLAEAVGEGVGGVDEAERGGAHPQAALGEARLRRHAPAGSRGMAVGKGLGEDPGRHECTF